MADEKGAHVLIVIQTIKHIHFDGSLEDSNLLTLGKETPNIVNIRNEIDKTLMKAPRISKNENKTLERLVGSREINKVTFVNFS